MGKHCVLSSGTRWESLHVTPAIHCRRWEKEEREGEECSFNGIHVLGGPGALSERRCSGPTMGEDEKEIKLGGGQHILPSSVKNSPQGECSSRTSQEGAVLMLDHKRKGRERM